MSLLGKDQNSGTSLASAVLSKPFPIYTALFPQGQSDLEVFILNISANFKMKAILVPAWEVFLFQPLLYCNFVLFGWLTSKRCPESEDRNKNDLTSCSRVVSGTEVMAIAHLFIQELPERWETTKKIAATVRHKVSPLQNAEVTLIRKKCVLFDVSYLLGLCRSIFKGSLTRVIEAIWLTFTFLPWVGKASRIQREIQKVCPAWI